MGMKRGRTIWFEGLSASGKSTLSFNLREVLISRGIPAMVLDGDILRNGLCNDLGFSTEDRAENLRRAAEVSKILCETGTNVIAAFITPLEILRKCIRAVFEPDKAIEIYVACPIEICEARDPKGLYRRAREGNIVDFTGITHPFEEPNAPDIVVPTGTLSVEASLSRILHFLETAYPDPFGNGLARSSKKVG